MAVLHSNRGLNHTPTLVAVLCSNDGLNHTHVLMAVLLPACCQLIASSLAGCQPVASLLPACCQLVARLAACCQPVASSLRDCQPVASLLPAHCQSPLVTNLSSNGSLNHAFMLMAHGCAALEPWLESHTCADGCAALEPWLASHIHADGCAALEPWRRCVPAWSSRGCKRRLRPTEHVHANLDPQAQERVLRHVPHE